MIDCKGHVLCPGLIDMQVFTGEPGAGAPRDTEDGEPSRRGRRRHHHRRHAGHGAGHRPGGARRFHPAPGARQRRRQRARHGGHDARPQGPGDDRDRPAAAGRRHRLHQRQGQRRERPGHAQRAALRQGFRRTDRASHRGPAPDRWHGDELGRGGDAARPARRATRQPKPSCSNATCASSKSPAGAITPRRSRAPRAWPSCAPPRRASCLSRAASRSITSPSTRTTSGPTARSSACGRRCARRKTVPPWCGRLAAGEIDVIVSSHDPQDADTKRHPFAEAADGAIGLETLLAAALRLYHSGEIALLPLLQGHDRQSSQAVRAARRTPRKGRAGRSDPGRPRPAVGGGQGARFAHARRTRPSTRAKCRAACS